MHIWTIIITLELLILITENSFLYDGDTTTITLIYIYIYIYTLGALFQYNNLFTYQLSPGFHLRQAPHNSLESRQSTYKF